MAVSKYKMNGVKRTVVTDANILIDATILLDNPVSLVMDDDTLANLDRIADRENVGRSAVMRALIRAAK